MSGAKLVVISALTATTPGWVTLNKASGSSLPTLWLHYWFPTIHFHVGLTFFAAQHNVMEDIAENSEMFFRSCGDSSEPVPSTKAEPVDI